MNPSFFQFSICCLCAFMLSLSTVAAQNPADVTGATILCNKEKFTIGQMEGCGNDCNEAANTCLDNGSGNPVETNSIWFTWKAANDGDLTFVIEALNPADRLNFVLVELPNGFGDGSNMVTFRCMAACNFNPIGLNSTDFDVSVKAEDCATANNGFLEALHMETGLTYALMVNNPNSTGGFTIEFGGDGIFEGPIANLTPDAAAVCFGNTVTFQNNSTFGEGMITNYQWNFGNDVVGNSIRATTANDPITVEYMTPGPKTVELTIFTDLGCEARTTFESIVTIEDCCQTDNKVTIADNPIITEIACPGDTNGAIDIDVTSVFPTTFLWSNGDTTEDVSNLAPGTYAVTVTSEATCKDSFSYEFIIPSTLSATESVTPPSCGGRADGAITITATGGRMPYEYDFGDGNGFVPNNVLNGLDTGDYIVIVRDASGCTTPPIEGIELDDNELIIAINSQVNPNCNGGMDGSIDINITQGIAPYQFDFNDGTGLKDETALSQLSAGDYIIDVFDTEQCRGLIEFSLTEPEELRLNIEPGRISCQGANDGASIATPSGGTPDYTYIWDNGQTTRSINGLTPGTYSVTVTDANGCQIDRPAMVTEPPALTASIATIQDITCIGATDGVIGLDISGGTPAYQFSTDGINFSNGTSITGLGVGSHEITVRDNNDCRVTLNATINSPATLAIAVNSSNNICYGESLIFNDNSTVTRGNVTVQEWDFGEGATPRNVTGAGPHEVIFNKLGQPIIQLTIRTDLNCEMVLTDTLDLSVEACCDTRNALNVNLIETHPNCADEATGELVLNTISLPEITNITWSSSDTINLIAGNYSVTVTNAASCQTIASTTLNAPSAIQATLNIQEPTCDVATNGMISITASGGTETNYEYDFGSGFTPNNTAANLGIGTYNIQIRDENGCILPIDTSLTVPDGLEAIQANLALIPPTCDVANNGSIEINNVIGDAPYEYDFGNGFTSNNTASNLSEGNYTIQIRDVNDCVLSIDTSLAVPEGTEAIQASLAVITPTCEVASNGSIEVNSIIGNAPYEYDFGNGFTANNIANNLSEGTYTIQIRDRDNCVLSIDTALTVPADAMPIRAFLNIINPSCGGISDGRIEVNASQGLLAGSGSGIGIAMPFEYDFGNGFSTNNEATGLGVGNYSITVRDSNNCSLTIDTSLNELVLMPNQANVIQPTCFGLSDGRVEFVVPNGAGPFMYNLNDGNGFQTASVLDSLPQGNYTIQIQDADLCLSGNIDITMDQPNALVLNMLPTNVSCFGAGDGQIIADITGGVGNYTHTWSNGQTTRTATNLVPGDYDVIVTDGNNCEISDNSSITEPDELSIAVTNVMDALCFGEANGSITVAANGGNSPFSYSLDGVLFQSSATIGELVAGDYTITVRDARDCETSTELATISEPDEFSITAEADRTVANLGFSVTLSATAQGNAAGVNYIWSTKDSVVCSNCPSFETIPPGSTTYTVVGLNSDNCTATASIDIKVSLDRPVYIPNVFSPNGDGKNDEFFIPFSPAMTGIDELQIFDRWGNLVYEAFNIQKGNEAAQAWDGEFNGNKLRQGVYVISAKISFVDGQTLPYQTDLTLLGSE